jgi:hypothetical protein
VHSRTAAQPPLEVRAPVEASRLGPPGAPWCREFWSEDALKAIKWADAFRFGPCSAKRLDLDVPHSRHERTGDGRFVTVTTGPDRGKRFTVVTHHERRGGA